mgnify:FL=1
MRYAATEKLEIICTIEGSHLSTKMTLNIPGIPRASAEIVLEPYSAGSA